VVPVGAKHGIQVTGTPANKKVCLDSGPKMRDPVVVQRLEPPYWGYRHIPPVPGAGSGGRTAAVWMVLTAVRRRRDSTVVVV